MERDFKFAVWGTQGGGLVREAGGKYIFVTKPDCPGLDVGDEMPEEWGLIPANNLTKQQDEQFDPGVPQQLTLAEAMDLLKIVCES